MFKGVGPKIIRSLALVSELAFGTELSWKDPVKFSFAHGGKDGWPESINLKRYDESIAILKNAVYDAKIGNKEKLNCIRRLNKFAK